MFPYSILSTSFLTSPFLLFFSFPPLLFTFLPLHSFSFLSLLCSLSLCFSFLGFSFFLLVSLPYFSSYFLKFFISPCFSYSVSFPFLPSPLLSSYLFLLIIFFLSFPFLSFSFPFFPLLFWLSFPLSVLLYFLVIPFSYLSSPFLFPLLFSSPVLLFPPILSSVIEKRWTVKVTEATTVSCLLFNKDIKHFYKTCWVRLSSHLIRDRGPVHTAVMSPVVCSYKQLLQRQCSVAVDQDVKHVVH